MKLTHSKSLPWSPRRTQQDQYGFTTIEVLLVIGIMMVLMGILSIGTNEILQQSRRETALSGIASVFRSARQGALTTNQPRRVVLETIYSGQAANHADAYELGPVLEFWVEKQQVRKPDWNDNYVLLNSPNRMPAGAYLVDINGRGMLPNNLASGRRNRDGTFSYFTNIYLNNKGQIVSIQRETRSPDGSGTLEPEPVNSNLALHFAFGSTEVDLTQAIPPGGVVDYISLINHTNMLATPSDVLQQMVATTRSDPTSDQEFVGRTVMHTLYLLRLTGQTANYDYGIYAPWPISPMPDSLEGPS